MPYREPFAWAIIPLFDSSVTSASGGSASPSSPLITSISGSIQEGAAEPVAKITLDGKLDYSGGNSVVVEVSNLSKVKEGYTEDSLLVTSRSHLAKKTYVYIYCLILYLTEKWKNGLNMLQHKKNPESTICQNFNSINAITNFLLLVLLSDVSIIFLSLLLIRQISALIVWERKC